MDKNLNWDKIEEEFLANLTNSRGQLIKRIVRMMDMVKSQMGTKLSGEEVREEDLNLFQKFVSDATEVISNTEVIENLNKRVKEVQIQYEKSYRLFIQISIALTAAIEARDIYTSGHTERVTAYCLGIAEELNGLSEVRSFENFKESLHIAALLHDIGKIGIPDTILNKKERLTADEIAKIREHPIIGATILYPVKELGIILSGVRSHQERFDGTGYPDRLKGKEIPLLARIIAVADTLDAITTNRPYRGKKSAEEAILEIKRSSGTQFDPEITEAFLRAYNEKKFFNFV